MVDQQRVLLSVPLPDPRVASIRRSVHELNNHLATLVIRTDLLATDLEGHAAAPDAELVARIAHDAATISARLEVETRELEQAGTAND